MVQNDKYKWFSYNLIQLFTEEIFYRLLLFWKTLWQNQKRQEVNVSKWENCRKFEMIESFAERRKTFLRAVWCWQQWQHNLVPSLTTKGKSKLYLASSDVFVKHIPNRLFALIIWFSGALYVTIRHCWSSYNKKKPCWFMIEI